MLEVSAATDDESDPDHSYDNPYNSGPIRNSLWLPRNPCGLLDLDDTINLSRALTSSDNPGDLRSWIVGSRSLPSDFQSLFSDHPPASMYGAPPESQTLSATVLRHSSNNKEIAFPPNLAPSIHSIHSTNAHEVSPPEHHSSIHGLRGYDWHNRFQMTPTTTSWPPIMPIQSEGREGRPFDPANRSASLPIVRWTQRSTSRDPELAEIPGKLPGVHASLELLTCSQ